MNSSLLSGIFNGCNGSILLKKLISCALMILQMNHSVAAKQA